jgi:hypothetical protein
VERDVLRRAGYAVGGLVVVAGAVVLLRNTDTTPTAKSPAPPPPAQTTVKEFADQGILTPQPGGKPPAPADLRLLPGPHRLQVSWRGNPDTPGYEIQLRGRTRLVTDTTVQLDGLDDNTDYDVQVRAVDAFGQRSDPITQRGRPSGNRPDESRYALVDHFDGMTVPDPARWQLANNAACAHMSRGVDDDIHHLVINAACSNESMALRSRTPLHLTPGDDGELGRVMIETTAPGPRGELGVDLVPGPADLVETSPRGGVPQGTVRVRITADTVTVAGAAPIPIDRPHAVSTRWEVVLRTDGVQVWRDGRLVGGAPVVPTWTEATPLFEFTGPQNGLNFVAVDAIGISAGTAPPYVTPPRVTTTPLSPATRPVPGQLGGQLRLTIRSSYGEAMSGPFTVTVGGQTFPLRPAVAGQQLESGLRYPVVADIPPTALLTTDRYELPITVNSGDPAHRPEVQHADLELTPDPGHPVTVGAPPVAPVRRTAPVLADITLTLLDAAGNKIENGPGPRGRVVLDVTATSDNTDVAGLAGVEVWVDNKRVAGIPTNRDGPAVLGRWRLALDTTSFEPGPRDLEVKTVSTDPNVSFQFTSTTWQIPY